MDSTTRKRLFDMEIDEISLVDRGANQHAAIVISKALDPEEDQMPDVALYDAEGEAIEYLEDGDVVYDELGNEYVFEADDSDDDDFGKSDDYEDIEKLSLASFKAVPDRLKRGGKLFQEGYKGGRGGAAAANTAGKFGNAASTTGNFIGRNRNALAIGGGVGLAGAGAGGGALYAHNRNVEKSLGDVVLEELSKAANEDQRSEVIAKAMEQVEIAKAQAQEAWDRVADQDDAMLESAFISKAAEYNLPVDPVDFGQILKAASTVLDYDQLELLDQLFNSVGEAIYQEVGYIGDTDNSSVLDTVNGYVGEMIGKSDYSPEELTTAVFEANPDAYDAYLAENRR